MTGNYKTERFDKEHRYFGGIIDIEDFNTIDPNKNRINNQVDAINLQNKLKDKRQEIKTMKQYQHMTLEELREIKLVSNTNGRPTSDLTNDKWQKEFILRKMFIKPYPDTVKKFGGKYSRESGIWNEETQGTYHGSTNYQEYCSFINDVLHNIRSGMTDYCYFIYQIMDLARFHCDTLKTRYCDGYWEVWLEG